MRNLKKVLALVLAVVMIFGVMSLTSATFTDDAKVSNTEAVEVMAGLQILTGYTDGSYQPAGNVTREEMATIICKMLLGPDVAKTLVQGTSNFKDVAANRWSAGYIEYCANLGIIDGYGDGTFNPAGNVTIGEAAKMLLVAAGIKGTYTGADWLVNVTANATKAGILPTTVDVRATATRDQVALYAFNALTYSANPKIVYNVYDATTGFKATYTDATQAYMAKILLGANAVVTTATVSDPSLGYKTFKLVGEAYTDMYGRPATLWYTDRNMNGHYDGKFVNGAFAVADEYVYLYTAPAAQTYTTPLSFVQMNELVNAYQNAGLKVRIGDTVLTTANIQTEITAAVAKTGFGVLTEVFVGKEFVDIVITPEYVDVVKGIAPYPQTTFQGAYTTYTFAANPNPYKQFTSHVKADIEDDTITWVGTPTIGSVATYTVAKVGERNEEYPAVIDATVLTNVVTGVVNSLDTAKSTIVINGTTYNIAKCFNAASLNVTDLTLLLGKTGTFYLDKYGYVAFVQYQEATNYAQTNYVKVYDTMTSYGTGVTQAIQAQLVYADATTEIVTVDKVIIGADTYTASGNAALGYLSLQQYVDTTTGLWANGELCVWKYVKNEATNAYTLTLVDLPEANKTVKAVQVFDGTYLTNNATTFVVRTGNAATGYTWKTYTGFQNLPTLVAGQSIVAVVDKNGDNVYDLVYIAGNPDGYNVQEFVYVTANNPVYTYNGDGTYTLTYPTEDGKGLVVAYNANGTPVADVNITGAGLYMVTRYSAASAALKVVPVPKEAVNSNGNQGLIKVGANVWNYNGAKLVVYVDNVKSDAYTFETLLRTSGNNYEYTVEAYVAPTLEIDVAAGTVTPSTTTIDTLYVVITTNYHAAP